MAEQLASDSSQKDLLQNNNGTTTEEIIWIVDEQNNPIRSGTRSEMHRENLTHRSTFIFLEDIATKKYYVHKRSMLKKFCPGYFDIAFGGVVQYGESYELSAERELKEESGVDAKLVRLFDFYFNDGVHAPAWGELFYARTSDQLVLQKEEVDEVVLLSAEEIQTAIGSKTENFTPDSSMAFLRYLQNKIEFDQKINLAYQAKSE